MNRGIQIRKPCIAHIAAATLWWFCVPDSMADDLTVGNLTVQTNATFQGTNNIAPNQVFVNSNSLLTAAIADVRYPRTNVIAWSTLIDSEGSNNPPRSLGYNGFAVGAFALAGGYNSIALGRSAYANGSASVALGQGAHASGGAAVAMNGGTTASGNYSVSMGFYTLAYGLNSVSMGDHSVAWGVNSVAMGNYTKAQGFGQVVIGQHNIVQGVATNWASTNVVFLVGNGASTNDLSNAFEITGNGDTWMAGTLTVVSNAVFQSADLLTPQGDLSMGAFTNSP